MNNIIFFLVIAFMLNSIIACDTNDQSIKANTNITVKDPNHYLHNDKTISPSVVDNNNSVNKNSELNFNKIEIEFGIKEVKDNNFIKKIKSTCNNGHVLDDSCVYNFLINKYESYFSDSQNRNIYKDKETTIILDDKNTDIQTDELGTQPSHTKNLLLKKRGVLKDSLEVYKQESLDPFMSTSKIFYLSNDLNIWILNLSILEDEIIINNWEKYYIDIKNHKFIKVNSVTHNKKKN